MAPQSHACRIHHPPHVEFRPTRRNRQRHAAACCFQHSEQWQLRGLESGPVISNFTPPQRQLPPTVLISISLSGVPGPAVRHRPGAGRSAIRTLLSDLYVAMVCNGLARVHSGLSKSQSRTTVSARCETRTAQVTRSRNLSSDMRQTEAVAAVPWPVEGRGGSKLISNTWLPLRWR